MLLQEYNMYVNPAAKIARLVKSGELSQIIKGLYETDSSAPGHYLAGIIYGPSYLSFDFALSWHGLIPEAVYAYARSDPVPDRVRYKNGIILIHSCDGSFYRRSRRFILLLALSPAIGIVIDVVIGVRLRRFYPKQIGTQDLCGVFSKRFRVFSA